MVVKMKTIDEIYEIIKNKCSEINALGKQLAATENDIKIYQDDFSNLQALEKEGQPGDIVSKAMKSNLGDLALIKHKIPPIAEQNRQYIQHHLDLLPKYIAAYNQTRQLSSLLAYLHDLNNNLISRLQESVELAEFLAHSKEGQLE